MFSLKIWEEAIRTYENMYVRIGRHTVLKIKSDQQHFSYFKRFFYRSFVVTNKSWSGTYDSFRPHNHSGDLKDISRVKYLSSCQTVFPIERVVLLKFSANAVKQVYLLLRVPSIIWGVFIWNWIVEALIFYYPSKSRILNPVLCAV